MHVVCVLVGGRVQVPMLTERPVSFLDPIGTGSLGVLDPALIAAGLNKTWTLVMNTVGASGPGRLQVSHPPGVSRESQPALHSVTTRKGHSGHFVGWCLRLVSVQPLFLPSLLPPLFPYPSHPLSPSTSPLSIPWYSLPPSVL